jgi:endonuclease/exonuclease/phosphatase family metal-dependent hydrolase
VLRSRENGASFLHANTHLDHVSEPARVQGNHLILKQTEGIRATHGDPPTIVTGDFICKPGTLPYRVFVEEGFEDTFLAPETRTTNALTPFTRSRESVSRLPTQTNPWGASIGSSSATMRRS